MSEKIKKAVKEFPIKPRDLIALLIVVAFSLLSLTNHSIKEFMMPLTAVVAFYFGSSRREDNR